MVTQHSVRGQCLPPLYFGVEVVEVGLGEDLRLEDVVGEGGDLVGAGADLEVKLAEGFVNPVGQPSRRPVPVVPGSRRGEQSLPFPGRNDSGS